MITLGINYLGGPGHDSAAALAIDGRIEFAIAEERLTRKKQDASFPVEAIKACLKYKKLKITDVDEMIFGWPELKNHFAANLKLILKGHLDEPIPVQALNYYRSITNRKVTTLAEFHKVTPRKITHIDHHMAHAMSVLPYMQSDESLIFIIDGRGISESTTVYHKKGNKLETIKRINFPNSLGVYYAEMTSLCGFKKYSDEWKVMGLAPYGENTFDLGELINSSEGSHQVDHKRLLNTKELVVNGRKIEKPADDEDVINNQSIRNLAHSAQYYYEQAILSFVKYYTTRYSIKSIGMAGGVGLNCKANGFLQRELDLKEFFIQPAATDDGTAIGAALYPFFQNNTLNKERFNPYLGNAYEDSEIIEILKKYKLDFIYLDHVEADAANELAKGNIIGWYQGRDEFGPRALGNRSIISDPRKPEMRDKVNEVVKYRESWRPFAPSILKEKAGTVLKNISNSPYMILTDFVREEYAGVIPAVVHVDQTLRPQTVDKESNPRYWNLINEFYKLTDVPVVMNTSFNLKGEPNVSSPTDAIRTFFTSGLNILYMGNYKIHKNGQASNN